LEHVHRIVASSDDCHAAGRAASESETSLATAPVKQITETRAKRLALCKQRTL